MINQSFLLKTTVTLMAVFGIAANASAQVTSSATATTTVVDPAAISKKSDLDFGKVKTGDKASTIVIAPEGALTQGGVDLSTSANEAMPAALTVTGASSHTYSITLPKNDHTLTHQNGNDTVVVSDFTSDLPDSDVLISGTQTIHIGATLRLAASQAPGNYAYSAGFNITVNYN